MQHLLFRRRAVAYDAPLISRCSETGVLVLGTHFCDPTGIYIRPDGDGWRFETAETDTR